MLESLERDECKNLVEKYGGRVTVALSGKTNYLIVGRDASEGKISKARESKVQVISEDDLLEMIRTRPGDEDTSRGQASTAFEPPTKQLKRKSSSTISKSVDIKPTTSSEPPAKKLKEQSSTITKSMDTSPKATHSTATDDSNLLCKCVIEI